MASSYFMRNKMTNNGINPSTKIKWKSENQVSLRGRPGKQPIVEENRTEQKRKVESPFSSNKDMDNREMNQPLIFLT